MIPISGLEFKEYLAEQKRKTRLNEEQMVSDLSAYWCQELCRSSWAFGNPDTGFKVQVSGSEDDSSKKVAAFERIIAGSFRFYCHWVAVSKSGDQCYLTSRTDMRDRAALGPDAPNYVRQILMKRSEIADDAYLWRTPAQFDNETVVELCGRFLMQSSFRRRKTLHRSVTDQLQISYRSVTDR